MPYLKFIQNHANDIPYESPPVHSPEKRKGGMKDSATGDGVGRGRNGGGGGGIGERVKGRQRSRELFAAADHSPERKKMLTWLV